MGHFLAWMVFLDCLLVLDLLNCLVQMLGCIAGQLQIVFSVSLACFLLCSLVAVGCVPCALFGFYFSLLAASGLISCVQLWFPGVAAVLCLAAVCAYVEPGFSWLPALSFSFVFGPLFFSGPVSAL